MDMLGGFIGSAARARLLAHFVVHPDRREHGRALERHTGLGKRSLQAELGRLESMGLVRRESDGRRIVYVRDPAHPQWRAIESLVGAYAPAEVLRDVLRDVPGVEAAFIFGSRARGDARSDSDIDLLVYGDAIRDGDFGGALLDASLVLAHPVDAKRYDRTSFLRDAQPGVSFLPQALAGPKQWLIGSPEALPTSDGRISA
ncbi:nucleotidyltransferase domain-containing protein [Longimicrobium sp.]|uniref:nucleotidyltransferase domain-containing protein n=1 Tax=Longimicrobium sp. TaxID=2029185 RepID=UPI002E312033|nr:nucleotidyltransferase domain-containing protein [Longimicrobium sp.]HEX6039338.1 nucleotidyltransferase domain-containing protein [Longimicrobium sp.]